MITAQKIISEKPLALVAGGAGFLGSFLSEALLSLGCRVICVDNLSTGKKENLEKCFSYKDFAFVNYDLTKNLPPEIGREEIAYIFNLIDNEIIHKDLCRLAASLKAKYLGVSFNNFQPDFPKGDWRIVNFPEVYGPRMDAGKFNLMKKNFPKESLFITDAIFALVKAMFSSGTAGKVFYLGPSGEEKIRWQPRISFEDGLRRTEEFFQLQKSFSRKIFLRPAVFKKKNYRFLFLLLGVFWLIVGGIGAFFIWNGFLGYQSLLKSQQFFLSGNFAKAKNEAKRGEMFFQNLKIIGKPAKIGEELARGLESLGNAGENLEALGNYVFQNAPKDFSQIISESKISLDYAYFYLSLAEGELKNQVLVKNKLLEFLNIGKEVDSFRKKIPEVKELIGQAKRGIEVFPLIIGEEKKQTYLVLLQNSSELRPTGGFIGSFAILTFEKGRFLDFEVQDVYWADGQLKGHVEPPPELKKYLGEANWYLRDVNWDPDFFKTALKAQWFLEKETGRRVDGVIGVNLLVAQKILQAVGEIDLPDYKEKINAANFFERAQYYSEIGFFPGSTQKQDFLGSVSRELFSRIKTASGPVKIGIIRALFQSLNSGDFTFWFEDPAAMARVANLGWDGRIKNNPGMDDYLMVVEANVGVNKANYFVEREIEQEIKISKEGEVEEKLTIVYQNNSPSENFPGGKYKNYLRILVPGGSEIIKVLVGEEEVPKEKIDVEEISSKTSFGFLVEIPPKEKKLVEISYRLPKKLKLEEKTSYSLFVQRQPGTKEGKFKLRVFVPEEIVVIPTAPTAVFQDGAYIFDQDFVTHLVFAMSFVR